MLNAIVNDLVAVTPDDPIGFCIDGFLKEAAARQQEPALLARLHAVKATLIKEQQEAVAEKAALKAELDTLRKGGGGASASAPAATRRVPPGHTPFSWSGGA
jgi:uncharacterized protein YPO0396